MFKQVSSFLLSFLLFSLITGFSYPQEIDIVPYLKKIEDGNKSSIIRILPGLLKKYPSDPSVLFLEGVLTENGEQASKVYKNILESYPGSRYADAAAYRLYNYYYTLGDFSKAGRFLNQLKAEYPQSPYISIANRNIPKMNSEIAVKKSEAKVIPEKNTKTEKSYETEEYKYTIQAGAC